MRLRMASPHQSDRYREWTICLIAAPCFDGEGFQVDWEGVPRRVPWDELSGAFAAEVGEPEGVRAVVFDLLCTSSFCGAALLRFSVDPSEGPKRPAQAIVENLGSKHCSASLQALAREGCATDCYSHLDLLDEALLEQLAATT